MRDAGHRTPDAGHRTSDGAKSKNNISTPQGGGHNKRMELLKTWNYIIAESCTGKVKTRRLVLGFSHLVIALKARDTSYN